MDEVYYSPKTIKKFMDEELCLKDKLLQKYFKEGDVKKFRKRLSTKKSDDEIQRVVYAVVTDMCRDIIMEFVGKLYVHMLPYGDLIVSGGEAFNTYLSIENRIITSDIDTKFVPGFKADSKFFGILQMIKLYIWDFLGSNCKQLSNKIEKRFKDFGTNKKVLKFLGIKFNKGVFRRYILIKKLKQNEGKNPLPEDVLIDVELFALDLSIKYYVPSKKKIEPVTLGGILDVPFMRPNEFGSEIVTSQEKGIFYRNPITGKIKYNENVSMAGKKFLIHDLYLMQSLGLRPKKVKKDKKRMYIFAKKVLKVDSVKSTDSVHTIFKKVLKVVKKIKNTRRNYRILTPTVQNINPNKYRNVTNPPQLVRLAKQLIVSSNNSKNGYSPTNSKFKFNTNTLEWKYTNSNLYIRNTKKYRSDRPKIKNIPKHIQILNTLYGYNPTRNVWVGKKILRNSAQIPFVGLKTTNITLVK